MPPGKEATTYGLTMQRAFLEQFMRPSPGAFGDQPQGPREIAAGIPFEASRALLVAPGPEGGATWRGLPAELACLAAALHLFALLVPGQVAEDASRRFAAAFSAAGGAAAAPAQGRPASSEALLEAAHAWGLAGRVVPSASTSLKAMAKNQAAVCCVLLEAYVGVLEDPTSGEEVEQEVGGHCVLVLGGDLSGGPSYVVFDPWGLSSGDVSYWTAHDAERAGAAVWVELVPGAEAQGVPAAETSGDGGSPAPIK